MGTPSLIRATTIAVLILSISMLLYFASSILIPLCYGLLIAFILYPICVWIEKLRIPRTVAALISISLILILIALILTLFFFQIRSFFKEWELLKHEMLASQYQLKTYIQEHFNVSAEVIESTINERVKQSVSSIFDHLGDSLTQIVSSVVMLFIIPIFSFLLLTTRAKLLKSIHLLFPETDSKRITAMLHKVIQTYYRFIKGMLIVYAIVAVLNSFGLWILGIPYPVLFGSIAAILTFIPYVGIMVGALLPISISWITYGNIWYPLAVIAVFSIVQYLEANIIFPYVVGTRLNLNTIVTLIAIFIGGIIWGVSGMILFVPFLAIVKLFADEYPGWAALSNLLSDK